MKKILLGSLAVLTLAIIVITSQSGCKKETVTNITATDTVCIPTIQGLWIGTQQNSSSSQAFSMCIKPGGTMNYENVISGTQQFCIGTWTLINSTLTCNTICVYGLAPNIGVTQTFTATYNATTGIITNGAYVNNPPSSGSGTFTVTEAN